jgi:hypothetical protein
MPSQWFCRVLGEQIGPVSFRELAEMVRAGTLKETDPVRREAASEWTRAKEVIGLLRAAETKPAPGAASGAQVDPQPASAPPQPDAAKSPAARPRRIGNRRVLVAVGIVALGLLAALISAWRSSRREKFPEPRGLQPADAPRSTAVQSPGRFVWDFRQGVDEGNMALLPGSSFEEVRQATPEGFRCTLPPGFDPVRYCGLRLRFDLRGDFEITAGFQILSLPPGERGTHPGAKICLRDGQQEGAILERLHLHDGTKNFSACRVRAKGEEKVYDCRNTPTEATSGRLRLRRAGTMIHYLFAPGDSKEFVELWATDFPETEIQQVELAAQAGGAPTGIDVLWTDLDVQADALVGIAGE